MAEYAEYIEREKLLNELNNIAADYIKDNSIQCNIAAGVVIDIKDNVVSKQPAANAVEVVRCRDCDNFIINDKYKYCCEHSDGWNDSIVYVEEDDYCSFAIKKR